MDQDSICNASSARVSCELGVATPARVAKAGSEGNQPKKIEKTTGVKRKREGAGQLNEESACLREREAGAEKVKQSAQALEERLLAAAPSTAAVFEILKAEQITTTLANAVTSISTSAKTHAKETADRSAKLWPSIEKKLLAKMEYSKNLKDLKQSKQKQLKLEVDMVPQEALKQWMNDYDAKERIMVDARTGRKLLTHTVESIKFTAEVSLFSREYGEGRLCLTNEGLTFTYCKKSKLLSISGKYVLVKHRTEAARVLDHKALRATMGDEAYKACRLPWAPDLGEGFPSQQFSAAEKLAYFNHLVSRQ